MVNEVKVEHVLILAIAAFLLYHFVGRCNCFNSNGFRVGGKSSFKVTADNQETARNILGISARIQKLETDLKECRRKLKTKSKNLSLLLKQTGKK